VYKEIFNKIENTLREKICLFRQRLW